ncbi:MAG: HAD family phosphatase [Candidatus Paceibacterota bacterium]|jgi:phosphoserine phosphatase
MIKMVFVDMSNTLVDGSGANSGADFIGKGDLYREIYPKYKAGKITMTELLNKTYGCWAGLNVYDLQKVFEKLDFNDGAKETIKKIKNEGIKMVLLTQIPVQLGELFKKSLGFDFITGTVLEVKNGIFTGKVLEYHDNKAREAMQILEREKIFPEEAVSIGDRKDDAEVFKKVRFGVSYNGDEAARKNAKYQIDDFKKLYDIIEKESNN